MSVVSYSVAVLLLVASWAVVVVTAQSDDTNQGIKCSRNSIENVCPTQSPVCCFDANDNFVGCCGMFELCDLASNQCVPAPTFPNETAVPLADIGDVAHMSKVAVIAGISSMVGAVLLISGGIFLLLFCRARSFDRAERERQLAGAALVDGEAEVCAVTVDEEKAFLEAVRKQHRVVDCAGSSSPNVSSGSMDTPLVATAAKDGIAGPCLICQSTAAVVLLLPCDHVSVCAPCSKGIRHCPQCAAVIQKRKKLFME